MEYNSNGSSHNAMPLNNNGDASGGPAPSSGFSGVSVASNNGLAPAAAPESGPSITYDLSSFDPLQAHALQLTASAGLTNVLAPASASDRPPTQSVQQNSHAHVTQQQQLQLQQQQQQQQQHHHHQTQQQQPQQQAQSQLVGQIGVQQQAQLAHTQQQAHQQQQQQLHIQPAQQQPPYYYLQPQTNNGGPLQQIAAAPTAPQHTVHQITPAPLGVANPAQSFLLPGTTQGAVNVAPGFGSNQLFSAVQGLQTGAGAQGLVSNVIVPQQFHSVVANAAHQAPQLIMPQGQAQTQIRESDQSSGQPPQKKRALAPSVVSSSTVSTDATGGVDGSNGTASGDSNNKKSPDLDKMTPAERRRHERNLREQQRSYRISQQIKELRDVLTESNVPFKPNKYSILLSVVDYIKQLQSRAIMLDAEHQKLVTTIRQTSEMVNNGNGPSSGSDETEETANTSNTSGSEGGSDSEMLFVQGLEYRSVFQQCPAALAIAALDGRILECNSEFQLLLGYQRDQLMKQSLFSLVQNHQDIFRAMADMLKSAEEAITGGNNRSSGNGAIPSNNRYWSGPVVSKRDKELSINITLTVMEDGSPKFFNCALTTA